MSKGELNYNLQQFCCKVIIFLMGTLQLMKGFKMLAFKNYRRSKINEKFLEYFLKEIAFLK